MTAEHRAANARLCDWLGVDPEEWQLRCRRDGFQTGRPSFKSPEEADKYRHSYGHTDYDPVPIYPDLATREGFWVLWDALKAKRYWPKIDGNHAYIRGHQWASDVMADKPWAALFAAAVALMQREGEGNGN